MDFERYVTEIERGRARAATAGTHGSENLVVVARTVSTNLLARGVAADYETEGLDLRPMLVLALEQSGGRGRQGRSWSSPRGQGVYATLAQVPVDADISTLRVPIVGASPLPASVREDFAAHTGRRLLEGYGLTEATCATTWTRPGGIESRQTPWNPSQPAIASQRTSCRVPAASV